MEVKSLSATAIKAWIECPARFVAENHMRAPRTSGFAANLGSCLHKALEFFVKACYMDLDRSGLEKQEEPTFDLLLQLYDTAYKEYFPTDPQFYVEGRDLMKQWYDTRVPLLNDPVREVLSTEVKKQFKLEWHGHTAFIPFNYIFDRVDRINRADGEFDIEVTDYKSWRVPRKFEDVERDVQMRIYGVAAQIEYPGAAKVWVSLDQLRYNNIGTCFTREQNIATWRMLQELGWDILHTEEDEAEEKINSGCRWCIRKASCQTLQLHKEVGGVLGIDSPNEIALKFKRVSDQMAGLKELQDELESALIQLADEQDMTEWETEDAKIRITTSSRRSADPQRVASIIGEELFAKYGNFNVGTIDTLHKNGEITEQQMKLLKSVAISAKPGNPKPKIELKTRLDES